MRHEAVRAAAGLLICDKGAGLLRLCQYGEMMRPSQSNRADSVESGQVLSGHVVKRTVPLPAISCLLVELEHIGTGARHVHIAAPDAENTFGVMLKTAPEDATGVAHILEHTALCGSRNFPVRDPFFSMLKRSMTTFMNAFTASDWTMYPFSTQNRKDFYNLMAVYLDAVFFPRLDRLSFRQEGHRLELEPPTGKSAAESALVRKGVVYNEMKGAMSSADQVAVRALSSALFPATTYRFNSGGDPAKIPLLTHEQLLAFHRRHYHPSNAFFYSYGDLPLADHLAFIESRVLRHFDRIDPETDIPSQPRWTAPKSAAHRYPADGLDDLEKKYQVTLGWLTADITDSYSVLVMSLAEQILLGNPASPLRKALLESGLGSSLSDGTGYSTDYRDTLFAAGLKDVEKTAASAVEKIVFDTLTDLASRGVDPELVESAIHQVEFSRKEKTNHPYPYGLKLLLAIAGPWIHGGDAAAILDLDRDLERIRRESSAGGFFEGQIGTRLIDNPHRVRFLLEPDPLLGEKNAAEEAEELDRILSTMDEKHLERIRKDTEALEALQHTEEDLSVLPTLSVSDIPEEIHSEPETDAGTGRTAAVYERPCGGIVYLSSAAGIETLPPDLVGLVPFLCYALPKLGTRKKSYVEISRRIDLYTGGIGLSANARTRYDDAGTCLPFVALSAKCLARNVSPMFDLLTELLSDPDFFAPERLQTLIAEYRAGLESAVVHQGHRLAISLAARTLSRTAALSELWGGVHQLAFIKQLAKDLSDAKTRDLAESLTAVADALFFPGNLQTAVIGEEPALSGAVSGAAALSEGLAPKTALTGKNRPPAPPENTVPREGWITSSSVSFVAQALPAVRMHHEDSGALSLLAKILRSLYLHREIREIGGAYGGLSVYNAEDGIFCLASYRDPHIVRTLKVYDDIVDFIDSDRYTEADVNEAKLQVCADIDRPDPPGPAARKAFFRKLLGLTDQERRRFKKRVLAATKADVTAAAKKTFSAPSAGRPAAVISGEAQLKAANRKLAEAPFLLRRI